MKDGRQPGNRTRPALLASPEPALPPTDLERRRLLVGAASTLGAVFATSRARSQTGLDNLPPRVPPWMTEQGAPVGSPPYGLPSEFEKHVIRKVVSGQPTDTAGASLTPLQNLHGIITPNGLVFERHHAGVPKIDPSLHRLIVHGQVERELVFTMDDIVRFPSVSHIYFLECSGNTPAWKGGDPQWTAADTHGLLSCCEWTGVPLSTLLDEVGLKPTAAWILAEGADAAAMTRSIPLEKALDDALLVYAQNGERLRPEQGYPLRLLLPGFEGNMSVKWLRRLEVGDQPYHTREETSKYTDLLPDGRARQFTFMMEAKSVVTYPSGGHQLTGGPGFYNITGLAWSGHGRIRRVDVSTDGGRSWREARLQQPVLSKALVRFHCPWVWEGNPAVLQSRAVDDTGYTQPTRERLLADMGENYFYHYNAIQSWRVGVGGAVTNDVA